GRRDGPPVAHAPGSPAHVPTDPLILRTAVSPGARGRHPPFRCGQTLVSATGHVTVGGARPASSRRSVAARPPGGRDRAGATPGTLTLNALAFANPFGQTGSGTVTIGGNPITFDGGAGSGFVTQNALGAVVITSNLSFANPNTALVFNGAAPGLVQLAGPLGQITGSPTNSIVINTHPLGVTSFEASNPNSQGPVTL